MSSEKSFADRAQRARDLLMALSSLSPAYDPLDLRYHPVALTAAIDAAEASSAAVAALRPAYQDRTGDRAALLKSLYPLATQALAHTKSNTAWANRQEAIKKAADKVRAIHPLPPRRDPEPDADTRATGERSYLEIATHFRAFIDHLAALPGYEPRDPRIGLEGLSETWLALEALNRSIPTAASTLAQAIAHRQQVYSGPTGLKAVYDGVKLSVKGQYGQQSGNYKKIGGMKW